MKILTATVRIIDPTRQTEGSGTVIGKAGGLVYVLTAHHVVGDADGVDVQTFTLAGTKARKGALYRDVEVMARATASDLALLRLRAPKFAGQAVAVCPPAAAPRRMPLRVWTAGWNTAGLPMCHANRITVVERVKKPANDDEALYWVVQDAPDPGNSGAAAVDIHGFLIGVCSGKTGKKGYFCHLEEIQRFLCAEGLRWLYNSPDNDRSR